MFVKLIKITIQITNFQRPCIICNKLQKLVRFLAYCRIKSHDPQACYNVPPIILIFNLEIVLLRWIAYELSVNIFILFSNHRLQLRLIGYLILVAPLAFMYQCQLSIINRLRL